MTYTPGQFPNESYLNGLRDNPESTLAVVYKEFRKPVIRSISALGGSEADGAVFFQMAVIDAARMARSNGIPAELPVGQLLNSLSLAHYSDWLRERDQPVPERIASELAGQQTPVTLPTDSALQETRLHVFAWKRMQRLDAYCRELLIDEATGRFMEVEEPDSKAQDCTDRYLEHLQNSATPFETMPEWARDALRDQESYNVWQRTQALEHQFSDGKPAPAETSRIWPWAIAALMVAIVGYSAYQFFCRPKTAAEVFADNFSPPASLLGDLEARYGAELGNDSVSARPNECMRLLEESDSYYRAKAYEAALDPLLLIVLDSSSICQSDAWYYLGIIQLQLEDPSTAIQCFSKIEDLSRYGEDLYWYQALAFVQLAKENPLMRDKARRAVERTLSNTMDQTRRAQAQTMLKNLSQ